jgi:heme/copper-type cytochrome/quinol oxidase subunit 2
MRFEYSRRTLLIAAFLVTLSQQAFAESRFIELAIHNGETSPKARVLSVSQNDEVVVRITSDRPLQSHLHGYDIESDIVPNVVTSLRFTATATGRFPIEVHYEQTGKHRPIAYVEVRPR